MACTNVQVSGVSRKVHLRHFMLAKKKYIQYSEQSCMQCDAGET